MQPSIARIHGSDETGNAAMATVQTLRLAGATTLDVDTVENVPAEFVGSMGTPHTFIDPITSEEITVISEATAVDFSGHVDGTNLEIDDIAPGYTDAGSAVGDIVIIRPTTQYADNIANVLETDHLDGGGHKIVSNFDPSHPTLETMKWVGVASAVNEPTANNAATGNPVIIEATGDDANIHLVVRGKGNGLTKISVLRQDDTTNSYKHNSVILTGWGVLDPGNNNSGTETVTFGITFAQRPIVLATAGGDSAATATYGAGGANVKIFLLEAYSITTTNFVVNATTRDGTSWTAGNKVFWQWLAIGEL